MLSKLLKRLGYRGIEDAVDFLMCGLGILPPLLMLTGFILAGAVSLSILLILVAAVGMHAPPPAPESDQPLEKSVKPRTTDRK